MLGRLLGAALGLAAMAGQATGEGRMSTTFFEVLGKRPAKVEIDPTPIRDALQTPPPPPAAPGPPGAIRPHGSAGLDGRSAARLAGPRYAIAWSREIDPGLAPAFVLPSRERIVLQGPNAWQLLDREGHPIRTEPARPGDLLLDEEQGLLYSGDVDGFVSAADLATGATRYKVTAFYGRSWEREALLLRGRSLWIRSIEIPTEPVEDRIPGDRIFEVHDLGDPVEVDEEMAVSARRLSSVMTQTLPLFSAMDGTTLVVAVTGHLYRLDDSLHVRADHTGEFEPLALSVDDLGRAHLVVRTEDDRARLWVVTREGQRTRNVELPVAADAVAGPPVLGYERSVFVLAGDRILAIPPDGGSPRELEAGRSVAGAVATPDPALLVASGNELVAHLADGERRVLAAATEPLRTPPALAADGSIVTASRGRLFRLVPER